MMLTYTILKPVAIFKASRTPSKSATTVVTAPKRSVLVSAGEGGDGEGDDVGASRFRLPEAVGGGGGGGGAVKIGAGGGGGEAEVDVKSKTLLESTQTYPRTTSKKVFLWNIVEPKMPKLRFAARTDFAESRSVWPISILKYEFAAKSCAVRRRLNTPGFNAFADANVDAPVAVAADVVIIEVATEDATADATDVVTDVPIVVAMVAATASLTVSAVASTFSISSNRSFCTSSFTVVSDSLVVALSGTRLHVVLLSQSDTSSS